MCDICVCVLNVTMTEYVSRGLSEWSATKYLSCASTRSRCNYVISHFQAETNWLSVQQY